MFKMRPKVDKPSVSRAINEKRTQSIFGALTNGT